MHLFEGKGDKMDDPGFLENIYSGFLDQRPMEQFQDLPEDEQTRDVIEKFLALNKKYPARIIENRGTVPPELLDELKAIHFFGLNIPEVYGGLGLVLRQYLKVAEAVENYIVAIISGTRYPEKYSEDLKKWIHVGASPRGSIALDRTSRTHAWLQGRDHVLPEDVPGLYYRIVCFTVNLQIEIDPGKCLVCLYYGHVRKSGHLDRLAIT